MARNRVYAEARQLPLVCTDPATPASGDPVLCGQIPGVAMIDERADGFTTVALRGVYLLSVKGENNVGNVAVAAGDILYYEAAATPKLNRDNVAGVRFGYALDAVTSGATATIRVLIGY